MTPLVTSIVSDSTAETSSIEDLSSSDPTTMQFYTFESKPDATKTLDSDYFLSGWFGLK